MKTILVLTPNPDFVSSVRAAVGADRYRVIHRLDAEEAEPLLNPALVDVCLVDADQAQVQGMWMVEKVRRRIPSCPVMVFTAGRSWEWEEEAYVQGVRHVLLKPVKPRLLNALLDALETPASVAPATPPAPVSPAAAPLLPAGPEPAAPIGGALATLRDLSGVLSHSLCAEPLLKQFLLLLREILGVNRSAIFLRRPGATFGEGREGSEGRLLTAACAIGLPQGLMEHLKLSCESGIGGYLHRHGRILRRESREAQADPALQKEFELLGAQVAVPIPDRESLVGVAVFDGRVTGEALTNSELELVFHLLESLGLAVKNIWLHDQLAANHEMLADVLRQLSNGCVVVNRDLTVLHANRAARQYFARTGRRQTEFDFSDLPAALGTKVYQVLKTGAGVAPFKYSSPEAPDTVYQVSVVPVQSPPGGLPGSALLIVEDHTRSEQLSRLEVETANLRLVRQMADRLAHEIGNALVPLSTHQQLFSRKYEDPEFRASLDSALAEGVSRVTRLINQMRYLARERLVAHDRIQLATLLEEAYHEAQRHQPVKSAQLKYNLGQESVLVEGDRASLRHAIAEIMINALQANPRNPRIAIDLQADTDRNGTDWLHLEFRDNGSGFSPEAVRRVPEPFFTTRNVGLGLGLVVSRKVAECHNGRLEIVPGRPEPGGVVRLSLPLGQPSEAAT